MYQSVEAQQESANEVCQPASLAAHPQLCGAWPGDEWPGALGELSGEPVDLCASSLGTDACEPWSCQDQPSSALR